MELWFSDYQTEKVKVSVKVEKQLFGAQTDYQRLDVFESEEFGRFISSDGSIVFSEKDEFTYDEMIVHVPMAVHPHVEKVLVIGGATGAYAGSCPTIRRSGRSTWWSRTRSLSMCAGSIFPTMPAG